MSILRYKFFCMQFYFPLDNSYNPLYGKIGKAIKDLYPIGIENDADEYNEYLGIKKITDLIQENFSANAKSFKPWKDFIKKLKVGKYKKISSSNSMPLDVAFSGEIILDRYDDASLLRIKRLTFSVSRIAPFFVIYGVDETFIKDEMRPEVFGYGAINVITESPYGEFKYAFDFIADSITEHFPDHDFIPIRTSLLQVEGLHTKSSHLKNCRVHNALFNDVFDFYDVKHFRGDMFFGSGSSNVSVKFGPPKL